MPVFGLLFGDLFLDEPFGPGTLAGLGIILSSVVLITGFPPPRRSAFRVSKNRANTLQLMANR